MKSEAVPIIVNLGAVVVIIVGLLVGCHSDDDKQPKASQSEIDLAVLVGVVTHLNLSQTNWTVIITDRTNHL